MSDVLGVPSYRSPDRALPITDVRRLLPLLALAQLSLAAIFLSAQLRARWAPSLCSARAVNSSRTIAVSALVALVILWFTCAVGCVSTVRRSQRLPSTETMTPQESRVRWLLAWVLLGLPLVVGSIYVGTVPMCSVAIVCD